MNFIPGRRSVNQLYSLIGTKQKLIIDNTEKSREYNNNVSRIIPAGLNYTTNA